MRLLRVASRIFPLYFTEPEALLRLVGKMPDQESLPQAELFWVRIAQTTAKEEVKQGKYQALSQMTILSLLGIV